MWGPQEKRKIRNNKKQNSNQLPNKQTDQHPTIPKQIASPQLRTIQIYILNIINSEHLLLCEYLLFMINFYVTFRVFNNYY